MTTATRTLWRGRILALLGVLFIALNVRTAVAAISPILGIIEQDIPLTSLGLGVLGMLPPVAFALAGLFAPALARKLGLDASLLIASIAMVLGSSIRAISDNYVILALGSIIALAGMGIGNILLPPAVKKYFPDRLATVTGAYVVLVSMGAAIPALFAAPVAEVAGWRVSVAVWAALAVTAFVPWLLLTVRGRGAVRVARVADASELVETPKLSVWSMARSKTAWAITIAFAVSSMSFYSLFAWLPEILVATAGFTPVAAGATLSFFGLIGIVLGVVSPILATKISNVGLLMLGGVAGFVIGYLGLALAPTTAPLLWVLSIGLGNIMFPLVLVLINLRSRTHHTSTTLSGFVQSIGYTVGALGPFAVALVHEISGGWTAPLIFLLCASLLATISAVWLRTPRFVEDELHVAVATRTDESPAQ
ncbi:MAG: CynX/NimT family MFS transporter [Rhodoglobus sp.]